MQPRPIDPLRTPLRCDACGRTDQRSILPKGKEMLVCSKCKAAGHLVHYCSLKCQFMGWKYGHKDECGKVTKRSDIPAPAPGYKRSEQLNQLISYLEYDPNVDWTYLHPGEGGTLEFTEIGSFTLDEFVGATVFNCFRNRAFRNGDMGAIYYIWLVLHRVTDAHPEGCHRSAGSGGPAFTGALPIEYLESQMKLQFGKHFEDLLSLLKKGEVPPKSHISLVEVERVLRRFKRTGRYKQDLVLWEPGQEVKIQRIAPSVGPNKLVPADAEFPKMLLPDLVYIEPLTAGEKEAAAKMKSKKVLYSSQPYFPEPPPEAPPTAPLYTQMRYLHVAKTVDYIVYGLARDPKAPFKLTFLEFGPALAFTFFRTRAIGRLTVWDGKQPPDYDAIAWIWMTMWPCLRRSEYGVKREVFEAQLGREYGEEAVRIALGRINPDTGKYVDEKQRAFTKDDIPARDEDGMLRTMYNLKHSGRFPELLGHIESYEEAVSSGKYKKSSPTEKAYDLLELD